MPRSFDQPPSCQLDLGRYLDGYRIELIERSR
jgi:hypothetical protein